VLFQSGFLFNILVFLKLSFHIRQEVLAEDEFEDECSGEERVFSPPISKNRFLICKKVASRLPQPLITMKAMVVMLSIYVIKASFNSLLWISLPIKIMVEKVLANTWRTSQVTQAKTTLFAVSAL
jgi:hypothetical protein